MGCVASAPAPDGESKADSLGSKAKSAPPPAVTKSQSRGKANSFKKNSSAPSFKKTSSVKSLKKNSSGKLSRSSSNKSASGKAKTHRRGSSSAKASGGGKKKGSPGKEQDEQGRRDDDAVSTASSGSSDDYTNYRSKLAPDSSGSAYSGGANGAPDAGDSLREFTVEELSAATEGFSKKLGEGGFGVVYLGHVDMGAEGVVPAAVKVLRQDSTQGFKEWQTELKYLGDLQHPNLVRLLGYSYDGDDWMLVYEYITNRSFDYHLFPQKGDAALGFSTRMKVLLGAAEGLAHLHGGCGRTIIYRDLKTANILVDDNFNAKLSDFGLAREGPDGSNTHVSTDIVGTSGYLAPEYMERGHVSERCDVYAFGVVILEVVSGKRVSDEVDRVPMLDWALKEIGRGPEGWKGIIDPELHGKFAERAMKLIVIAARGCISDDPHRRPPMSKIVAALQLAQNRSMKKQRSEAERNEAEAPATAAPPPKAASRLATFSRLASVNIRKVGTGS